jgi:hypothetical protein
MKQFVATTLVRTTQSEEALLSAKKAMNKEGEESNK